jgi:two-component system nitrate/nitrite response regulator NarL
MERISVIVVDDHPLFLRGTVSMLQAQSDIEVVAHGLLASVRTIEGRASPDVVLVGATQDLPGDALRSVCGMWPVSKVIVRTSASSEGQVRLLLGKGVRGCVRGFVGEAELVRAIRSVHSGAVHLPADWPRPSGRPADARCSPAAAVLSTREAEVLAFLRRGLSNKEIGRRLCLSEKTIKHYVTQILVKTCSRNRVEAAISISAS